MRLTVGTPVETSAPHGDSFFIGMTLVISSPIRASLAALGLLTCILAAAQQPARSLRDQIVGTWIPVSQYVEQGDKRLEPFGSDPKGLVVYDSNGRFSLVLLRATLPRFASNNRLTGTAEENKAVVQGSIAYFGRYTVDEREKKLLIHYDGSTFPNWDGEDQVRLVDISGDEMNVVSPVSAVGGGTVHLRLRRSR